MTNDADTADKEQPSVSLQDKDCYRVQARWKLEEIEFYGMSVRWHLHVV